ncbi:MAG: hypothetical protein M1338_05900 [Patescibacteria group bacterium]|nr:hypothetical protein [Patescibacteria group bacterium]
MLAETPGFSDAPGALTYCGLWCIVDDVRNIIRNSKGYINIPKLSGDLAN